MQLLVVSKEHLDSLVSNGIRKFYCQEHNGNNGYFTLEYSCARRSIGAPGWARKVESYINKQLLLCIDANAHEVMLGDINGDSSTK